LDIALVPRHDDPNRFDLINRRVRRVKLSRQVIKPSIATGLLDFPFLSGSHFDFITLLA
jgi:hypothetical protein